MEKKRYRTFKDVCTLVDIMVKMSGKGETWTEEQREHERL